MAANGVILALRRKWKDLNCETHLQFKIRTITKIKNACWLKQKLAYNGGLIRRTTSAHTYHWDFILDDNGLFLLQLRVLLNQAFAARGKLSRGPTGQPGPGQG